MGITFISNTGGGVSDIIIPEGGVIFSESSTEPSSEFTKITTYASYYIYSGSAANSTGGNSSHTHSLTSMTSGAGGNHTHTSGTLTSSNCESLTYRTGGFPQGGTSSCSTHNHSLGTLTITSGTGSHKHSNSSYLTSGSATNSPPYVRLYMYQATATGGSKLPIGSILMWYGGTLPSGFSLCDGISASPNMKGKFVRDSTATSYTTHAHTVGKLNSGGSHTHTASITTNTQTYGISNGFAAEGGVGAPEHTHTKTGIVSGGASTTHIHDGFASGTSSQLPTYIALYFMKYTG